MDDVDGGEDGDDEDVEGGGEEEVAQVGGAKEGEDDSETDEVNDTDDSDEDARREVAALPQGGTEPRVPGINHQHGSGKDGADGGDGEETGEGCGGETKGQYQSVTAPPSTALLRGLGCAHSTNGNIREIIDNSIRAGATQIIITADCDAILPEEVRQRLWQS